MTTALLKFRKRLYHLLETDTSGPALVVNAILILFIIFTLIIVFLESESALFHQYQSTFIWLEYLTIAAFTIEYLARIWVHAEDNPASPWISRLRYLFTPLALIDLLAILPFYLGLFIQFDTRYLRVIRLLRILKLTRYASSLNTLLQVLKNELPTIISALSILLILITLTASMMYLVEHEAQPDKFGSIPQAIWWSVITLTTVGYGDVVPVTSTGRILGMLITILGVGIAALPAGILASGFTTEMQNRRDEFRARVISLLAEHGTLTHKDRHDIEKLRRQLGLNKKEGEALLDLSGTKFSVSKLNYCPHCGKRLPHPARLLD